MNYRHAFHAGNFADCLKHAVLIRILAHLAQKPAPFHVVDTHAGVGLYDLAGDAAGRTGEWRDGIGRLADPKAALSPAARDLLAPLLDIVAAVNAEAGFAAYPPRLYPGSPVIAARLLRRGDQLSAVELHPEDHASLAENLAGDRQARVYSLDGWLALKSFLPVKERRGLVLVDPPFEQAGEFERLVAGLVAGHRRFATGVYLIWYPIKDERAVKAFRQALVATGIRRILAAELRLGPIGATETGGGLAGTGIVVVNPPWTLAAELRQLLPELARLLARTGKPNWRLDELAGE
jgi:23S rRNA (adenine2030-N6)-methyltransferase